MLIERLLLESGLKAKQLDLYVRTASKRYFVFPIKKRDGSFRTIAHPARPIKSLQRWLNSRLIRRWPVHPCATAYRRGYSIRENAIRHAGTNFTLRVDFEDYFPSFKSDGIKKFLLNQMNSGNYFAESDLEMILSIITRNGELTIGAPSSPLITNTMMFEFDQNISIMCEKYGIIYTRYADDLFLSTNTPHVLSEIFIRIEEAANKFPYANLKINKNKTKYLSKKFARRVTGLTITPEGLVSIGRSRKREIRSLINSFQFDQLDEEKTEYLKGLVAFSYDVDRMFYESLIYKYSANVVAGLIGSDRNQIQIGH